MGEDTVIQAISDWWVGTGKKIYGGVKPDKPWPLGPKGWRPPLPSRIISSWNRPFDKNPVAEQYVNIHTYDTFMRPCPRKATPMDAEYY